jgi:hypothetical protein
VKLIEFMGPGCIRLCAAGEEFSLPTATDCYAGHAELRFTLSASLEVLGGPQKRVPVAMYPPLELVTSADVSKGGRLFSLAPPLNGSDI